MNKYRGKRQLQSSLQLFLHESAIGFVTIGFVAIDFVTIGPNSINN